MASKLLTRNSKSILQIRAIPSHGRSVTAKKLTWTKKLHPLKSSKSFFVHSSTSNYASSPFKLEDFCFEDAKKENFDEFLDIMIKCYVPRNVLYNGMGVDPSDPSTKRLMERRVRRWIDSGVSYYYIHRPTNEIAALVLNDFKTRETRSVYMEEDIENYSEPVKNMQKFLYQLEKSSPAFNDPSIKRLLCIAASTTTPKFERLGLASVIIEKAIQVGKDHGCDGIITESTSFKTQKLCIKLGFQEVSSINYENFEIDGKKVIDTNMEAMKGTTRAVVYLKDFRN